MSRKIVIISALCVLMLGLGAATSLAGDLYVPSGYATIQAAINAAIAGDVIHIAAGTYNERPVVNKSLTIAGADEATVIIDAGAATSGTYGFSVTADNVTISDLTLVGDTSMSTPRYGFKPSSVSNFTLSDVTAKEFYRTGVDLLGVTNGVLTDITSIDNDGHGLSFCDCNGVTVTNLTVSGNAWQGVSVATWGEHSPLGTSGIVFAGTNSFVDPFQLEMGDYNNPGVPPAGVAIITYSTNPADLADVTVLASDFGFAVHGEQDDSPGQVRIWFADTFANAALLPAYAPIGHFTGNGIYIESLTDATQLYVTPGCSIQAAIDAADDYDTINVSAGTYVEALLIEKPLSLLGATAGINKNGYTVPTGYAWDDAVESIIQHPNPAGGYTAIVDIHDTDDVVFKGFIVEELSAVANQNSSLVRVYAHTHAIDNIVVENNVIGPNTNTVSQDGTHGRMGLYLVNHPYSDQGITNSSFSHNTIFGTEGNGNNIFLWSAYYAYGAPGPASMAGTVIDDNEIYGSHRSGIETAGGFSNLTISNNDIYGNSGLPGDVTAALKYGHGILLIRGSSDKVSDPLTAYGPVDLVITGNDIHDNEKSGIYTGPKNDGIYITDNLIHDNGWNGVMVDLAGNYWNPQFESPPISGAYACYDCSQDVFANDNSLWGNGGAAVPASDYGVAVNGTPTNSFVLDASWNWWGHPSGPYHDPLNTSGLGDPVSDYVDIDPYRSGNIVCDPDPDYLSIADQVAAIDVDYMGGGSGLMYGYIVKFSWDGGLGTTSPSPADVTQGTLLSSVGSTFWDVRSTGTDEITVTCIILGAVDGVTGPGTMFSVDFDAVVPIGYGVSPVDITIDRIRDKDNNTLSGFFADDGEIIVDTTAPSVTNVLITNTTLVTNDYIKHGDGAQVTATVTDVHPDFGLTDIEANLFGLGGASDANPNSYDGTTATWTLGSVTCVPTDGTVTVTVTATDAHSNTASAFDTIIADNTAPTAVTGFDAAPGNQQCDLSWTNGTDSHLVGVEVRRYGEPGEYPQYPWHVANYPSTAKYPVDELSGDGAYDGTGSSYTDAVVDRNIYYYQAFCYDEARNYGPADAGARDLATNYWLGDVSDGWGTWGGDGLVEVQDILKLSGAYGMSPPMGDHATCDVGPTVHPDWHRLGLPLPDNNVEFEDAMIFAMNYGVVTARVVPFLPEEYSTDVLALTLSERELVGSELEIALRLEGNSGEVKGVSAAIAYDADDLEFVSARLSDDMSLPLGDVFFWSGAEEGRVLVDALVLGTDVTIGGCGNVAVLTFRVVGDGYSLEVESARIRNADNVELVFRLVQNAPNPFNPVTKIAYHVPCDSEVTIRVFDVSGRAVRTLVDGVVEPGRHVAVWNGRNDAGESVGSGIYFCTMEAPDFHDSRKMTLLK